MSIRMAVLLAVAMGCDNDPGPHDEVNCSALWGMNVVACERACEPVPPADETCTFKRNDDGSSFQCAYVATFEGVRGCCDYVFEPGTGGLYNIRWFECLD